MHVVRNHVHLYRDWSGWRLAGRDLISPHGERINRQRLEGLLWRADAQDIRDAKRNRKKSKLSKIKVVIYDLDQYRRERFGTYTA
ncbi:MAG: phage protein [Xanthomonadaceae bacterium]|jgi:hypothetical protein|nr:phage protein [Xanthomonadaceae bacterium]